MASHPILSLLYSAEAVWHHMYENRVCDVHGSMSGQGKLFGFFYLCVFLYLRRCLIHALQAIIFHTRILIVSLSDNQTAIFSNIAAAHIALLRGWHHRDVIFLVGKCETGQIFWVGATSIETKIAFKKIISNLQKFILKMYIPEVFLRNYHRSLYINMAILTYFSFPFIKTLENLFLHALIKLVLAFECAALMNLHELRVCFCLLISDRWVNFLSVCVSFTQECN